MLLVKIILFLTRQLLLLALAVMYYHGAYQYKIKILSTDVQQWSGWAVKYENLEEIQKDYPEFLPHVCPRETRLPIDPKLKEGYNDWSVYWESQDGLYSFDKIYEPKRIANVLECPDTVPTPYLSLDGNCFLHHDHRRGLQKGIYYINQMVGRGIYYEKRYYSIGAFIEIGEKGWRIAGYDIPDSDIIPLTEGSGQEPIHCENYISPLLPFGEKHMIKKRNNAGYRQRPEFILRVLKDDSWPGMIFDPGEDYDEGP